MDKQILTLMKNLGCSKEEAEQIIADDKAIDRGEKMPFDLDKETEKMAKKYANVSTKSTKNAKTERKPKEDVEKESIIKEFFDFLNKKGYENAEIVNKNNKIAFTKGENHYTLTLTKNRKK